MINTTHKNANFQNQINVEIPRSGIIDPEIVNPDDLCYQCQKNGPDIFDGKLMNKYFNDEPHFTGEIK